MYNAAVSNRQNLFELENSPYFAARRMEAELEEERQEAKREGEYECAVKMAMKMHAYNEPIDKIADYTDLDTETIQTIITGNK